MRKAGSKPATIKHMAKQQFEGIMFEPPLSFEQQMEEARNVVLAHRVCVLALQKSSAELAAAIEAAGPDGFSTVMDVWQRGKEWHENHAKLFDLIECRSLIGASIAAARAEA